MKKNNRSSDPITRYLKIDYQVFQTKNVVFGAKVLWAHFNSFKEKGCWQKDEQLAKEFSVSLRSISSWISQLKKVKGIVVKAAKSPYRRIWSNEQYKKWLKTEEAKRNSTSHNLQTTPQNTAFDFAKSAVSTSQNMRTTINILKRNNGNEIATLSHMPVDGQAPVLLEENGIDRIISIENLNRQLGARVQPQKLSVEEIERRKCDQKKRLKICD